MSERAGEKRAKIVEGRSRGIGGGGSVGALRDGGGRVEVIFGEGRGG